MIDFCSFFDGAFASRAAALHRSLLRHSSPFRFHALALDAEAESAARAAGMSVTTLAELEAADPELAAVKPTRTRLEYHLTCTPAFPRFLFRNPELETLVYLDADVFFFGDPAALLARQTAAVGLTEHRFSPRLAHCVVPHGRFNDGWVSMRRGAEPFLDWWREKCLDWCYDRVEPGRFTEQKYLDEAPALFGAQALAHRGANVAPWNLEAARLEEAEEGLLVDGEPLLFFHFSGFRRLLPGLYQLMRHDQGFTPSAAARRRIYAPYIKEVGGAVGAGRTPTLADSARNLLAGRCALAWP